MKKSSFIVALLFILGTSVLSAQGLHIGKLKVKAFNVSYGQDQDLLRSMDTDYFSSMIKDPIFQETYNNLPFKKGDVASMICENPNIHLGVAFELPKNIEWNIGVNSIFNRVDAVAYSYDDWWTWENPTDVEYMNFSTYSDEIALETSISKRISLVPTRNRLGNSPVNLYLGAGTNMGVIFDNEMYVYGTREVNAADYSYNEYENLRTDIINNAQYEYFSDDVKLNGGFTQRVYAQAGIGFTLLRRVELGFETRYGYGYRAMKGADTKSTQLRSFALSARWILK